MNRKYILSNFVSIIARELQSHSDTPQLDAELLVAAVTKQSRAQLFAHPEKILSKTEQKKLLDYVERRIKGEPLAYVVGHQEFWSLDFKVTSDVLIPRPETEMLVEWALSRLPKNEKIRVADLGTGSGAIAIALAYERKHWSIDATENSKAALYIAKENVARHSIDNVHFYLGQWCAALPRCDYDAILGNPPYIPENDIHLQNLTFEPQDALRAGEDGLDAIRKIIAEAKNYLKEDGLLVLEHGYDQGEQVLQLMEEYGYQNVKDHTDLAGLPRMIVGCKS